MPRDSLKALRGLLKTRRGLPKAPQDLRFYIALGLTLVVAVTIIAVRRPRPPELRPSPPAAPAAPSAPVPVDPRLAEKYRQEPVLSLYIHETGETRWLKMEDYLPGVVAAEMDPTWPVEALAAQAVLSRTITLKQKELNIGPSQIHKTDACTLPEHLQAWEPEKVNDRVREAVKKTRGLVLTYRGNFAWAWYSSYSGGKTATPEEYFAPLTEPVPYIPSVDDPGKASAPEKDQRWTKEVTRGELRAVFGPDAEGAATVEVLDKGPSGRPVKLRIGQKVVSGRDFRVGLGLRSGLITDITPTAAGVVLTGSGWGHGVGMSQWGAYTLASQGRNYRDILNYYFRGVDLSTLWK